jgi:methyl-accepting chemotaxis protein
MDAVLTRSLARAGIGAHGGRRGSAAVSARPARVAQVVLGLIWLIDGMLQLQPFMFGKAFVTDVLLVNAAGQPGVIAAPITQICGLIEPHVAAFNACAATLQILIGLGLLCRRTVRPALAVSFAWALAIWFTGEGLGGIFTGAANPLTGAPGAALLYVLAGLMCWPGDDGAGLIGARAATAAWAAMWLGFAVLWLLPANDTAGAVHDAIAAAPTGAGWLSGLTGSAAAATAGVGTPIAVTLAVLSAAIGLAVLCRWRTGFFLGLSIALSVVFWLVGQGLGGVFTGQATDVSTAPVLILVAAMFFFPATADRRSAGKATAGPTALPVKPAAGPPNTNPKPLSNEKGEPMAVNRKEAGERAEQLLQEERARADKALSLLLLLNFPLVIGLAAVHGYWLLALLAGAALSFVPLFVVRSKPGSLASRLTIAAAFMGYAALLIQEVHGSTESHFYVFVGLAFLLMYRDWRVPLFGGLVIAVHHLGFYLLQAAGTGVWVFDGSMHAMTGVDLAGLEMVGIHAAFVIFEVGVLIYIWLALEGDTRSQAEVLFAQEQDHAALLALAEGLQARDLTVATDDDDAYAGGAISTLRTGIGQVAELVRSIERTAAGVASASSEMATTTADAVRTSSEVAASLSEMASGAQRQVHAIDAARRSVAQVTGAVSSSAESAARTLESVSRVRGAADRGAVAASDASAAAQAVSDVSSQTTEAIGELAAKSEQIGAIVETITGIAAQTNLLALNAAIEAARAGESGRGFAVVAEEVRKLAEESQKAAAVIAGIVGEIQSETRRAVSVVEDSHRRTSEAAATAEQTRTAFEHISEMVAEMAVQAQEISDATSQISEGAEHTHSEMESMASVAEQTSAVTEQASAATQETSASSQQVAASAESLAESAEQLRGLVSAFRLSAS